MYIELGKIVGVWGVKGWLKLHSYCRNRVDIANHSSWWLQRKNDDPVEYKVLNCREQGPGIVAQLDGITDRNQAELLNGQTILISQSDLPESADGQFYWQQLVGLTVFSDDQEIGKVASLLETGANDVLVVAREGLPDALIPYIDEVIAEVDLEHGRLIVDWDVTLLD